MPFLRSKRNFWINRFAAFTLLAASIISWSIPAKAQLDDGVAAYVRQSPKLNRQAAKQQRKATKKYIKAQRKAAKEAKRHSR
jgi:hypothetical protein